MLDLEYLIRDGTHIQRSRIPLAVVPECMTISACSDNETAGEDISSFGGWETNSSVGLPDRVVWFLDFLLVMVVTETTYHYMSYNRHYNTRHILN